MGPPIFGASRLIPSLVPLVLLTCLLPTFGHVAPSGTSAISVRRNVRPKFSPVITHEFNEMSIISKHTHTARVTAALPSRGIFLPIFYFLLRCVLFTRYL